MSLPRWDGTLAGLPLLIDPSLPPGTALIVSNDVYASLRREVSMEVRWQAEPGFYERWLARTPAVSAQNMRIIVADFDFAEAARLRKEAEWRIHWYRSDRVGTAWWDR